MVAYSVASLCTRMHVAPRVKSDTHTHTRNTTLQRMPSVLLLLLLLLTTSTAAIQACSRLA